MSGQRGGPPRPAVTWGTPALSARAGLIPVPTPCPAADLTYALSVRAQAIVGRGGPGCVSWTLSLEPSSSPRGVQPCRGSGSSCGSGSSHGSGSSRSLSLLLLLLVTCCDSFLSCSVGLFSAETGTPWRYRGRTCQTPSWPSKIREARSRFTSLRELRSSGCQENPINWLQEAKPGSTPRLLTLSHHRFFY